ncbi:MAG: PD-(D/E)XK nuclease family protein [Polyangiaceae bacterium]|nr:PD-(D/E)XK nuclease family protein [Polyangiaceae bacterium]
MSPVRAVVASAARDRVELALAALRDLAGEQVLVVGPSRAALDELALSATAARGATSGIHRKTLGGLAMECAALPLALRGKTRAPAIVEGALARAAARDALAAGELARFGRSARGLPIAATPGFGVALARTLADLDAEGIDAVALRALPRSGPDLATLAQRVRAALDERGLATRADALRAAAAALDESPLCGLPLILLDVPIHGVLEQRFVAALLQRAKRAVVLAPAGDLRSLRALRELGVELDEAPTHGDASPALTTFGARLFAGELDGMTPLEQPVATLSWAPTEALEAVEVTRLVLTEAQRGVGFDDIAIVVPSRDTYASHLSTALGRAGVPVRFEVGTRRPHPSGRALLALLACRAERGSGRRLFEFVSTGQLARVPSPAASPRGPSDEELGRFGDADDVDDPPDESDPTRPEERPFARPPLGRWLRLLGEIGVFRAGAGESIARYFSHRVEIAVRERKEAQDRDASDEAGAAPQADAGPTRLEREIQELGDLACGLGPVLERLDEVPLAAPWAEVLARICALAEVALRRPLPVLALLAELHPLGASTGEVPLDEVLAVLTPPLTWLERPGARGGSGPGGAVTVTTPRGLLGRRRRVVMVMGLAEGLYPAKHAEDPLLPDEARARLGLRSAAERTADERLGLKLAAGCASERCHFTYPRADSESGRARVPSVYALEIARAISGRLSSLDELVRATAPASGVLLTWPAPSEPSAAIDDVEYALSNIRGLVAAPRKEAMGRARFLIDRHPIAGRALRARYQRHDREGYNSDDGLLASSPWVKAALAHFRLTERPYSPSALEGFTACPYRFYLRSIAGLTARAPLEQADRLGPAAFGDLYHQCQARLAERLVEGDIDPQDPASKDRALEEIRAVIAEIGERARELLEPLSPRLFEAELARVEGDLAGWLEDELTRRDGYRPFLSDLAFGVPTSSHLCRASVSEPVTIEGGFKLRGAIDSIERDAQGRLRVTDFKTGRAPDDLGKLHVVRGGEMLQPMLYALAVEALRGTAIPADAVVLKARLYFATRRGGYAETPVAVSPENVAHARRVLEVIDQSVRRAVLFARPREGACAHCDYRVVCGPNEEVRTARKMTDDDAALAGIHAQLRELRGLS